jgi:hypothetical protein
MILNNYPNIIIDCIAAAFCFSKPAKYFTNDLLKTREPPVPASSAFERKTSRKGADWQAIERCHLLY